MNTCAKCNCSISPGEEVWVRRRSTSERVPLCAQCAQELRQAIESKQEPQRAAVPTEPGGPPEAERATSPPPASHKAPIEGILILILVVLIGAPVLGGLVALVGRFIYLIILFPIAIGMAGGFVVALGVRWGKVRSSLVAASCGLLLGVSVYGCYRYVEYLMVRRDARNYIMEEMEAEFGQSDATVADAIFDEILLEETGKTGFLGNTLLEAQEGMSISPVSSALSLNIGTTLTWVYWALEMLVITGVPALIAVGETSHPFCDYHNRWYEREKSLGGIAPAQAQGVIALLEAGHFAAFGKSLNHTPPVPGIEFFIERCIDCEESSPILTIKAVKRTGRGRVQHSVVSKKTLTPAQGKQILEGVSGGAARVESG